MTQVSVLLFTEKVGTLLRLILLPTEEYLIQHERHRVMVGYLVPLLYAMDSMGNICGSRIATKLVMVRKNLRLLIAGNSFYSCCLAGSLMKLIGL